MVRGNLKHKEDGKPKDSKYESKKTKYGLKKVFVRPMNKVRASP